MAASMPNPEMIKKNKEDIAALNAKTSITVTRNTTYISGTNLTAIQYGRVIYVSGYFAVSTEVPVHTQFITINKANKMGINVFAIAINTSTGVCKNIYISNNDTELKPNGTSIPSGEYVLNFSYIAD